MAAPRAWRRRCAPRSHLDRGVVLGSDGDVRHVGFLSLVAVAGAGAWWGRGDVVAGSGEGVPAAAERVDTLTVRVTGLLVAGEEVQRMAVVDDLLFSPGTCRGPDQ